MPMPSVDNRGNNLPNIYHTFVNHIANFAVCPDPIVQSATKRQHLCNPQARPRNFTSDAKDLCHYWCLKLATTEADSADIATLDRADDRVYTVHRQTTIGQVEIDRVLQGRKSVTERDEARKIRIVLPIWLFPRLGKVP